MVGNRLTTLDTRRVKPPEKQVNPFYRSVEWRGLMRHLIKSRGRRCQECGRTNTRIFGDHIHELFDGGAELDPSNIKLLCGSCHTKKTIAKRTERIRANP